MQRDIEVLSEEIQARFRRLKAPLPVDQIEVRKDGRPKPNGPRLYTRFVAYIELPVAHERLDSEFAGQWSFVTEPQPDAVDSDGVVNKVVLGSLTVYGVTRQDCGMAADPKSAVTDAFKRACRLFGIGLELYTLPQLWIEVDQHGEPLQDPKTVLARYLGGDRSTPVTSVAPPVAAAPQAAAPAPPVPLPAAPVTRPRGAPRWAPIPCEICGSRMYDNSRPEDKLYPNAPDYRCSMYALPPKGTGCKGAVRLAPAEKRILDTASPSKVSAAVDQGLSADEIDQAQADDEDLPF